VLYEQKSNNTSGLYHGFGSRGGGGLRPISISQKDPLRAVFAGICSRGSFHRRSGGPTNWMARPDPSLRELLALAALAAFGCGLALAQGGLLFLAIFAAASVVTIIEAVRRSR